MAKHWIQGAVSKMKEKGTVGKFGKATPKKIAHAMKEAGRRREKGSGLREQHEENIARKKG